MEIRKIRFRQSGGFAGLVRGSEVEPDAVEATDLRALEQLTRARGGGPKRGAAGLPDQIVYEIEVETDTGTRRLAFDEGSVPKELSALVEALAKRARPVPP